MKFETALAELLCRSVDNVIECVSLPGEKRKPTAITWELIRYAYALELPQIDEEIPVTSSDLEEYARIINFSLLVQKKVLDIGSPDSEIVSVFKMIIRQLAQDLWIDAEIIEARFEVV